MSAHRGRGSLWHLNLKRSTLGAGLLLLLALSGCPRTAPEEEQTQEARSSRSGAEIRRIVDALYKKKGEDAYTDPTLDPLLVELEGLARGGDKDAASLRGLIIAKRRLALRAQNGGPRTPESKLTRHGKVTYDDEPAPEDDDGIARAEAVAVGTPRDELKEAYGSCLIRQTWFAARGPGGVTTELFHVAPDCRKRLKPRVFRVAEDRVQQVSDGDLDGVMEVSESATEG